MNKKSKLLLTALAALTLGLTACNPSTSELNLKHNNKLVKNVELSTTYEECSIGDSFQIIPTITFVDDVEVEVFKQWKSSKTTVATVTQDGFVEVVGNGTTFITFRAGYSIAECKVYDPDDPVDPTALKITLSATSRTLNLGDTFTLTATPSKAANITFTTDDATVATIVSQESTDTIAACEIKAGNAAGETDVYATSGDTSVKCHIVVIDDEDPGELDYTVYFYIDYNNVDPNDNTKCLAKFDWYEDRPLSESGKVPTVSNSQALDPAFPYFIGWSTHPIIDTKDNLWDISKDTIADLPMNSYTVILYGQWMDVQVLPA